MASDFIRRPRHLLKNWITVLLPFQTKPRPLLLESLPIAQSFRRAFSTPGVAENTVTMRPHVLKMPT
jgi:hypothetical protein